VSKRVYAHRGGKIVEITGNVKGWYMYETIGFPGNCPFLHENINVLYGVSYMTRDKLPNVCSCGAPLTYADEVVFCNETQKVLVGTKKE